MAWVVFVFLWVLGRTLLQQAHPRFFFRTYPFEVKRMSSTDTTLYCLT